jgi:hypothetical protein
MARWVHLKELGHLRGELAPVLHRGQHILSNLVSSNGLARIRAVAVAS